MAEDYEAIYRNMVDAWNTGEVERLVEYMAEDVEIESFLIVVEGAYRGHEGVRQWWSSYHDTFPDWHAAVLDIRANDAATAALLRLSGHGGSSGAPVDLKMWHVVLWREGLAKRISAYEDEATALEAAGLEK